MTQTTQMSDTKEQAWKHLFVEQFISKVTGEVDENEALETAYEIANSVWPDKEGRAPEDAADDEVDAIASSAGQE